LHVSPRFLFGKFFDRKGKKVAEKNKDVSDTPTKEENQETQNVENTSLASKSLRKKVKKLRRSTRSLHRSSQIVDQRNLSRRLQLKSKVENRKARDRARYSKSSADGYRCNTK